MANRNNNFNFKIPGIIILLSFIFCWPVGVVLHSPIHIKCELKHETRVQTGKTREYCADV